MTQDEAQITVLEHEVNTLRGLRLSQEVMVAQAAVKRERELAGELTKLKARVESRQPELALLREHSNAA